MQDVETLLREAEDFITICYQELGRTEEQMNNRIDEVRALIIASGTYVHTSEELRQGARMAWRNSNRCIGRLFWESLHMMDERQIDDVAKVADALLRHIRYATNKGKLLPTITIFRPGSSENSAIRIWNHQLIRYAGYEQGGQIVGDPASIPFTKVCQDLGWIGEGTAFDILPLVIQMGTDEPHMFPIPKDLIMEVPIRHPDIVEFVDLGLRWYAVPIIADMMLEIGGIQYSAAPFNGWYMETEIGARNLADVGRYNMLPQVASVMGLSTKSETTLWRDRALVELNVAVLYSFKQDGVSMVDHHTAASQFQLFEQREAECPRHVTGDWKWLIPPLSPATTHIFHTSYDNTIVKPNFFQNSKKY
ncbi:MAG TPA: nitric oxide synthase oxygenase [Paenibacillus sp.]|jgi:nitric-oxide synthase